MIRQAVHGEVTKRQIAECARIIFERNGYSAASMEEIQEECGLSKDLIACYFKNKEDIFIYCVKDAADRWLKNWEEQNIELTSATDKLYLFARHYASMMASPFTYTISEFLAVCEKELPKIDTEEIFPQIINAQLKIIEDILTEGIYDFQFKHDINLDTQTMLLFSTLTGLRTTKLLGYEGEQYYKLYHHSIDAFIKGLQF